jgi:peptide/nickel transport system substrate-binding protein
LKDGPFGGTFRWSNPLDIDTFNFMVSSSAYANNINSMMWDSLIAIDGQGNDVNWLAESYLAETHDDNSEIPEGYTQFTFNMIQNATWTDGRPITAEDAAFSLNYFRDSPGNPYGPDLSEMTAAYAPTPYTLIVQFSSESFWHLHTVSYKPVIPKHVFQLIGLEGWNLWNPNPPVTSMVTSGPFNVSDYVAGEFCEMTYNPNYFYDMRNYEEDTGPTTTTDDTTPTDTGDGDGDTPPPVDPTMALVAGAVGAAVVILVGGYVLMRQK